MEKAGLREQERLPEQCSYVGIIFFFAIHSRNFNVKPEEVGPCDQIAHTPTFLGVQEPKPAEVKFNEVNVQFEWGSAPM